MSGHSKWANIKHKKGRADAKRGKMFTRLGKEITIASRNGGGDLDGNPRLRLAVQNAKAANMPGDNIKRAILKGTGEIPGVTYEEYTYEGYAPLGVAVILETVTDNKTRTYSEIRSQFQKFGGNLGETNSVAWSFDRTGVITVKTDGKSEDEILELVLEADAEDVEYGEESSRITCPMEMFGNVNTYFQNSELEVEESKLEYLPQTPIEIKTVDEARRILKFIDHFEDHDDVQNLYSNVDIDDSILEQLED